MSQVAPSLIAGALLLAITAYSTAGGVDFGAGVWDLLAGNSGRGREARALIDHAMAPVWEVNNVWLVLAIVLCWTGFPLLFQSVFASLYPLYVLALLGLVLRGSFFAFRHVADNPRTHRAADLVFGISSFVTPFFFAASLGAIGSGEVAVSGPTQSVWQVSFSPMALVFGVVSVAATAFSGAVFLVGDARRYGAAALIDYFRVRALAAMGALIVAGTLALVVIQVQAPDLVRSMLLGPGLPFVLVTTIATPVLGVLLWWRMFTWFRVLSVVAVGSMVFAWGFAQAPYVLPHRLSITQAIAPFPTQVVLLVVAVCLVLVIAPAMGLLYYLDQRSALESP